MKMHLESPPRYEYKHILLWNNWSRPLTDPQLKRVGVRSPVVPDILEKIEGLL